MINQLVLHLNRELLGTLTLSAGTEAYQLEYAPSWLAGPGFAISPHLLPGACPSEAVKRFLANLLPEGRWLDELSVDQHISKGNLFGLIAVLGGETSGALTFQADRDPPLAIPTTFRPVTSKELQDRITSRQQVSIARWDGKPRLSVAGVQDKLPMLITASGELGFGEGELASTHILKFGQRPEMHMVLNEYCCMELARRVKLPVARVALQRFGEPVLVVARYDRLLRANRVERLHLIDGCQMLDLPPTYKYERPFGKAGEGAKIRIGASLPQLFVACRQCRIPAAAMRDLLRWALFQLLIGNNDAHGKNISFFVGPKGIDVAPAYDLLNIEIYGEDYDRDLAMAIGDTFRSGDIFAYQLAEMCEDCHLSQRQVALTLKALGMSVLGAVDSLPAGLALTEEEGMFVERLIGQIKETTARFLELAKELPQIRV